jgi:hypothetical protein
MALDAFNLLVGLDAGKIPALEESRSRLDRFTRLINTPEYEHGIQGA